MGEFGRTPLLILAASIGGADDWVLAAASGALTLTPLRMMSDEERSLAIDRSALLRLTDLGYLNGSDLDVGSIVNSPLNASAVVLLLSWSLQGTVARLDGLARTSAAEVSPRFAPEDWREVSHHFVDDGERHAAVTDEAFTMRMNTLPGLPTGGRRHFIFGALADPSEAREPAYESVPAGEPGTQLVDPLVYTNPGRAPEG